GACRQLPERTPAIHARRPAQQGPQIGVERAEFALNLEEGLRIADRTVDLETIANNPWILEQPLNLGWREARHPRRIEIGECSPVVLALLEDRLPAQARLRTFEREELEERAVVVNRHPPLVIVVHDADWRSSPGAANTRIHVFRFSRASRCPRRSSTV